MPGRSFNTEFVLNFQQFDIYILTIFGEYFGCLFIATVRNVKKFLAVARHGQTKIFPNMVNIYIKLQSSASSAEHEFSIKKMIWHR